MTVATESEKVNILSRSWPYPWIKWKLTLSGRSRFQHVWSFGNGNAGIVCGVLRKDVFVLDSSQGSPILVHAITCKGHTFITVAYGWPQECTHGEGRPVVQPAISWPEICPVQDPMPKRWCDVSWLAQSCAQIAPCRASGLGSRVWG